MLQQLSDQVRQCLRRAAEAKAQAGATTDPALKKSYSDLEGSWLFLARSYMFSESLQDFIGQPRQEEAHPPVDSRLPVVGQLFDVLPSAVYVCDASGTIIYFNSYAAKLWGRSPSLNDPTDILCGPCRMYRRDDSLIEHPESPTAEVLRSGDAVQNREMVVERADGSHAVMLVNINPVKDRRGNVLGAINCLQDVTERKRSESLAREIDPTETILAIFDGPKDTIQARIGALAKVHALFVQSGWAGAELSSIVKQELAPYLRESELHVRIDGPTLFLAPKVAQAVAVILHELTTNALRHGSLSVPEGQVRVRWSRAADGRLILQWMESRGPPANKPTRKSFSTSIIDRIIGGLRGEIHRDWRPQGLACQIVLPAADGGAGAESANM